MRMPMEVIHKDLNVMRKKFCVCVFFYSSFIHSSVKLKTTKMSKNGE